MKINSIKEQLNIIEVVEHYTGQQLKNNKILCPFHSEKTASFVVYENTDSFYCFGCNFGGDIICFVEKYKNLEFLEAIKLLAKDFDIKLDLDDKKMEKWKEAREEKKKLENIYQVALEYFESQLKQEHIEFISGKYGLDPVTIKKARIGFSGINGGILKYLRTKGFSDEDIYKSGLVTKKTGQLKDMYYNRLMIPYIEAGRPIYFTGRSLNGDDDLIKYLNLKHISPEVKNPLFYARLKGVDTLLLVEGEFTALAGTELIDYDVIGLGKSGLSKHKKADLFKLIKRYEEVIIINDTDENKAGIKGAINTAKAILEGTDVICMIGQLDPIEGQDGTDIADYNREGKDLEQTIKEAIKFIELLSETDLIEVTGQYIKTLWKAKDLRELASKVKIVIPFMKNLNRVDSNLFIEEIRRIVKNKTSYTDENGEKKEGQKNALGTKQDFLVMINEEKQKDKYGNKFTPSMLAKKVVENIEEKGNRWAYVLVREKGFFYFYDSNKGYWKEESESYFKNEIREVLREHNQEWENSYKLREASDALKQDTLADRRNLERFDAGINPDLKFINCKNGMLDWKTGQMKKHNPDYYSLFQMNVNYNPEADCPKWEATLKDWINEKDTIKFLQEYAGYCLIPDTSYQKALILHGAGSNGKSVFLEVLKEMLGTENCGENSLAQINSRFGTISIKDNLANIAPDIDPTYLEGTGTIKNIIRGEGISGEYKGKDLMKFRPVCRLLFSCNELPRARDKSEGWLRSFEIVEFKNKFEPTDPNFDPDLKKKLLDELDGIFNWALEGLKRLKTQEHFTLSDEIKKAKADYQKENDTVQSFIEEVCELDVTSKATTEYLFRSYIEYCKECNYKPVNRNVFIRTLQGLGVQKTHTTFEVCKEHSKYKCSECCNPELIKKRKRGFKGLKVD